MAWTWSPRGKLRRLVSILNTSAQYSASNSENVQAGIAGGQSSRSETEARTLSPSFNVTWGGGISTSLQYNKTRTDGLTSGNINRRERRDWNVSVNFLFRTPIVRLPNQVRTTASYRRTTETVCLIQAGTDECVPISESYRKVIDLRMDTGVSPQLRAGANFSYSLNAQRQTSQERSTMVFSIFAEVFLVSGQLR